MNANELADELNKNAKEERQDFWSDESGWCDVLEKAAIMLRQQQAEIEALKAHPVKELTDRISELENQLGFIASINRAGLGVVTATPMSSEKIEKIWNAIEEQKDDNFHYGWKKCEQYYGFSTHPVKEQDESFDRTASHMAGEYVSYKAKLTDEEINKLWAESHEDGIAMQQGFTTQQHYFAHLILRKAQK